MCKLLADGHAVSSQAFAGDVVEPCCVELDVAEVEIETRSVKYFDDLRAQVVEELRLRLHDLDVIEQHTQPLESGGFTALQVQLHDVGRGGELVVKAHRGHLEHFGGSYSQLGA